MARYSVWVAKGHEGDAVEIHSGDDADAAAEEVYALVAHSGSATFSVGIDIGPMPGTPTTPEQQAHPQQAHQQQAGPALPPHGATTVGGRVVGVQRGRGTRQQ